MIEHNSSLCNGRWIIMQIIIIIFESFAICRTAMGKKEYGHIFAQRGLSGVYVFVSIWG